jgi:hypothetical protein
MQANPRIFRETSLRTRQIQAFFAFCFDDFLAPGKRTILSEGDVLICFDCSPGNFKASECNSAKREICLLSGLAPVIRSSI